MEYPKLEPEFKKKWTSALRSGEYGQAEGLLYDPKLSYNKPHCCCLGVAEHILGTPLEEMNDEELCYPSDLESSKLPEFLQGDNTIADLGNVATILSNMNDGNIVLKVKKHSFEEIADWIDENL